MKTLKKLLLGIVTVMAMATLCAVWAGAKTYGDYEYSVLEDGTVEISYYSGNATELVIPSEIDSKKVTSIGYSAFESCISLTSVTIPDSVTSIGSYAFSDCTLLESITIADSVTSMGDSVFYYCTSLTSIVIPDSVTSIGDLAFLGCESLTSITIADSVTSIGDSAFFGCGSLTSIIIPDSVTSIRDSTFFDCESLTSIIIPDSVTSIGDDAFSGCSDYLVIKGYTGSYAETYAKENNIDFEAHPEILSDVTSFKIAGRTSNALRVNWDKVPYADGYIISIYDDNKWVCVAKITDSSTTTYRVTGLNPGTTYQFRISAYRITGTSSTLDSGYTNVTGTTAPSTVAGFKLGARVSDAIRLNWTENTSADGYIIEKYDGTKWVRVAKITSNETTICRIAGLTPSTTYKFRIKAYNMVGSVALYSGYSNVTATTTPSPVAGLEIGGKTSDALRLNWIKNTSADGYIIEMYDGAKWVRVTKITDNATITYRVAGLTPSTTYKLRIKAYNMVGSVALYSSYSNVISTTIPSPVAGLEIGGKASDALRLNWDKNDSADGYIIEMYDGGKWVRVTKITSNTTLTYRKAGLESGTTYQFRVCAYNMVGSTALYSAYAYVNGTTIK